MRTSSPPSAVGLLRDRIAVAAALLIPPTGCAALVPFRDDVPNTDAALVLVAVIVAVAANGHRAAGLIAAASGAASFDFFLTAPYHRFAIDSRDDVETTMLLLLVGAAVTELAVRGRHHRLVAMTDEQYLDAIQSTSETVGSGGGANMLTTHVTEQVRTLLGLRQCRFESTRFGGMPRLHPDGRVTVDGAEWDVAEHGLPGGEVELLVAVRGTVHGRLVLTGAPDVVPALAARRCAAVLAEQLAGGLASARSSHR